MTLNDADLSDIKKAKQLLEKGGVAVSMGNWCGHATEKISERLPLAWRRTLSFLTILAIEKSWEFSIGMMSDPDKPADDELNHKIYATISGAIGGVAIPTLLAELPVTTVIMFRSVADMAREEGENFQDMETRIACLEVFALGGGYSDQEGASGSSYYKTREFLERPIIESSKYIAQKGAVGLGVPFLGQLIAKIAARYQTLVAARIAASVVPIAGAICGAAVNIVFIDHFQKKARGHFIMRRLEKKYGLEKVKLSYNQASFS